MPYRLTIAVLILSLLIPWRISAGASTSPGKPDREQSAADSTDSFDPALAAAGRRSYISFCARCHGLNMVTSSSAFYDLRKFPKGQPERFVNSVKNGKRGMPAWKSRLSDEKINQLWHYLLSGGQ